MTFYAILMVFLFIFQPVAAEAACDKPREVVLSKAEQACADGAMPSVLDSLLAAHAACAGPAEADFSSLVHSALELGQSGQEGECALLLEALR